METIEFKAWPKIARLNREVIITEKIDGTNAAIIITEDGQIGAQSRNRLITPQDDNYGFAKWVEENKEALIATFGPGRHFGEWWGKGIQRGYNLDHKRFSLFNISRYADTDFSALPNVGLVPVLNRALDFSRVPITIEVLKTLGSVAAPGYMNPEGVVAYHVASDTLYKVTIEGDEKPKSSTEKPIKKNLEA